MNKKGGKAGIDNSIKDAICSFQINEIITKLGCPIRVYVQKGRKSTAIITFHDIGTNHNSFKNFFNYSEMILILENFTIYHICAPGHHIQNSKIMRTSFISSKTSDENLRLLSLNNNNDTDSDEDILYMDELKESFNTYPSLDDLSQMIESICEYFQLKYFLGIGVGAGANILARFGIKYPSKLLGLFLINPDDTTSGYYQWTKARWSDLPSLRTGLVTDWLENYLLNRWFGSMSERNFYIQEYYLKLFQNINHMASAGFIDSYLNRSSLGLVRPVNEFDKNGRTIDVESCLITGEFATDLTKMMIDMNGNMNPTKTQFISIPNSSGMVMDEAPDRLCSIFLNFLRNLGIVINVNSEKRKASIVEQQVHDVRRLSGMENPPNLCELPNN